MLKAPDTIAVGICDSHEIALAGLSSGLVGHGIDIYGTATHRDAALAVASMSSGRIVLIDAALRPGPDSAEQVISAVALVGGVPIAMGVSGDPALVFPALRAGAVGYLTKDLPLRAWADAIHAARRGEALLSRTMTATLIAEYRAQSFSSPAAELLPSDRRLTRREWQVLELVAAGKTNKRVADDLSISIQTVRTHVSNILAKLETPNRSAATAKYHHLRAVR
jgi:DNA-binding NarL/FixJ family response regulator